MESNFQLFVYGSLRKGFHHPAYQYMSHYFSFVTDAKIKGLLSDMGDYPAATPTTEEKFIVGELYAIKDAAEFNWAMEQLDDYEGLNPESDEGEVALFRRELTQVFPKNGEPVNAWVYWYNGDVSGMPVIESGDVLAYFKEKNKLQG